MNKLLALAQNVRKENYCLFLSLKQIGPYVSIGRSMSLSFRLCQTREVDC